MKMKPASRENFVAHPPPEPSSGILCSVESTRTQKWEKIFTIMAAALEPFISATHDVDSRNL